MATRPIHLHPSPHPTGGHATDPNDAGPFSDLEHRALMAVVEPPIHPLFSRTVDLPADAMERCRREAVFLEKHALI